MTAKRNMIVFVSALMAFLVPLICSAQQTGSMTLETLQAAFRSKQVEIEAAFAKASSDALNTYGKAIEPARKERKNAGDLDAVLALDEELKRFASDRTIPAPDKIPAAMAGGVATYRKSIANAEAARTNQLAVILNTYVKSLDSLVKRLTKQDKLDDAKAAKAEMNRAADLAGAKAGEMRSTGSRQSANLVLNGDFKQGLSVGWIEKSAQPFPDPTGVPDADEYKAPGKGSATIVVTDGLPTLEITHQGRGVTKVYQDIPVNTLPSKFSGDFRFHLVDTWGHSSFLAFIELALCDKDGNVLGKHVWYYGALRENWGIQTRESTTSSKTNLRESQVPFGELESRWINCQLDISKALRETLTGIDQSKLKTVRITMDGRSDSKKGHMKMWARHIQLH